MADETRPATLFAFLPRIGYVFAQQERFLPGSLEIVGEPSYFTVFEHQTAHVGGVAALLKYNVSTGTTLTPYLVGGAGVSYASDPVPPGGSNFNFMLETGLGLAYPVKTQSTINLEWRYLHFSNAHTSPQDPGLNSFLFLVGVSFLH